MTKSASPETTFSTKAVDVHGHYGNYIGVQKDPLIDLFMTADAARMARRAAWAGIEWTVVSPLLAIQPRGKADAVAGNDEASNMVPNTAGLRQWVVIDPLRPETYRQAEAMLRKPWCVGIKIHPEEHVYFIRDHGKAIFEFAALHRAVVLTHSGGVHSIPEEFVPFANSFPEVKLILAHLGHMDVGDNTHQVRAIQAGRHRNLYVDTSSAKSILSGLIEWAVREIGPDRILFGTDTPLYFAAMQRMRIEQAEITEGERRKILSENARLLLKLK
jgi:hypothetical protein